MAQAWDPSHVSATIVLSGANLVATSNAAATATVYAATPVTTGRYYWEVLVSGAVANIAAGIGNVNSPPTGGSWQGLDATSLGWWTSGVFSGGANVGTWATFVSGNVLAFALDLISGRIWGRVGAAGNWNNAAIGSQNPAVGSQVGGLVIPVGVTAAAVVPGANLAAVSDVATGRFGAASWVGTPPVGFQDVDQVYAQAWRRPAVSFFGR